MSIGTRTGRTDLLRKPSSDRKQQHSSTGGIQSLDKFFVGRPEKIKHVTTMQQPLQQVFLLQPNTHTHTHLPQVEQSSFQLLVFRFSIRRTASIFFLTNSLSGRGPFLSSNIINVIIRNCGCCCCRLVDNVCVCVWNENHLLSIGTCVQKTKR